MFTASEDGHLKIWDTRSGRNPVLTRNFDNGAPITDAVMHANQGELITCDQNGAVKIWDLTAHSCTHELVSECSGVELCVKKKKKNSNVRVIH